MALDMWVAVLLCACAVWGGARGWGGVGGAVGAGGWGGLQPSLPAAVPPVETYDEPMMESMQQVLRGSNTLWFFDSKFNQESRHNFKLMRPLFVTANAFLEGITKPHAYPKGFFPVAMRGNLTEIRRHTRRLTAHYAGILLMALVTAFFLIVFPVLGFLWCCYWWLVGSRYEDVGSAKNRFMLTMILAALVVVFLAGVVCVFESDSQLECGIHDLALAFQNGLNDTKMFFLYTQTLLEWLIRSSYTDIRMRIGFILNVMGKAAAAELTNKTRASVMGAVSVMVDSLSHVRGVLTSLTRRISALRISAEQYNSGIHKIREQIEHTLSRCNQAPCIELRNNEKLDLLNQEIHFDQVPDVTEPLNRVSRLLDSNIREEVANGLRQFKEIRDTSITDVSQHSSQVLGILKNTGRELTAIILKVRWVAGNVTELVQYYVAKIDMLAAFYGRYGFLRQYLSVAASVFLLLILFIMVWGLICCLFGQEAVSCRKAECCDKNTGALSLLWGMRAIFVLAGVVAVAMLVFLIAGAIILRFVCDPLSDPRHNRLFNDVEAWMNTSELINATLGIQTNLSSILARCHQNLSFIEVLQLQDLLNMKILRRMSSTLRRRLDALPPYKPRSTANIVFLSEAARIRLHKYSEEEINSFRRAGQPHPDPEELRAAMELSLTPRELDSLALDLNRTASALMKPRFDKESRELLRASVALSSLAHNLLKEIDRRSYQIPVDYAYRLQHMMPVLRMGNNSYGNFSGNSTNMTSQMDTLMAKIKAAQEYARQHGAEVLSNFTKGQVDVIKDKVVNYVDGVVRTLLNDVGRCGPLSRIINVTKDVTCKDILWPMNGFWVSLLFCLVMLLPMLVFAQLVGYKYMHVNPCPTASLHLIKKDVKMK